jgi:hypothetical protein
MKKPPEGGIWCKLVPAWRVDMIQQIEEIWRWLFAEHYSETPKCKLCGDRKCRSRMVHIPAYGWFCDENHADVFWLRHQW